MYNLTGKRGLYGLFPTQFKRSKNIRENPEVKYYFNSQAPDQKSNPQAPDRTYTSISVKTLSQTLEIATKVFAGAEKHNLTLNYKIYLKNSQKLINFI